MGILYLPMGSQLLKFYKLHNLKVLLTDSLFNFRHTPPAITYFYFLYLFILLYEYGA